MVAGDIVDLVFDASATTGFGPVFSGCAFSTVFTAEIFALVPAATRPRSCQPSLGPAAVVASLWRPSATPRYRSARLPPAEGLFRWVAAMASGFSRHVLAVASSSPHGCVLEWGRLLEHAGNAFYWNVAGSSPKSSSEVERVIREDPRFGALGSSLYWQMRRMRNAVAHDPAYPVNRSHAIEYARHALRLGTALQFGYPFLVAPLLAVDSAA